MSTMTIRPIRTEADYEAALARVSALMDVGNRSSDEEDEYDVLLTLIERYEDEHFPMDLPDPLSAIKFRMEQQGLTQSDLAPFFGSRAKVSEVLNGKRDLTLKTIRALHEHLGIPLEVLVGHSGGLPQVPAGLVPDRFPLREMVKRGWLAGTVSQVKERTEELFHALLEQAGGQKALPQALLRQGGARDNAKTDSCSLQAWCLHILGLARKADLEGVYRPGTLTPGFLRDIACLSSLDDGPLLAKEELARNGIALIVAEHLPKTYLDGAALFTKEGVPVVGMTLRFDRLDNFWFCLLHELAHLGRHFKEGAGEVFIDDLQLRDHAATDQREEEADAWAQEALIPPDLWHNHPAQHAPTVANVLSLARSANVHPAIIAGRIRYEHHNYRLLSQLVVSNTIRPLLFPHGGG